MYYHPVLWYMRTGWTVGTTIVQVRYIVGCTVLYHHVLWYVRTRWTVGITIDGVQYTVGHSILYSGTWGWDALCTNQTIIYVVHKRTETQSRTFWGILRLVWTFVGNSGHVWEHHSDVFKEELGYIKGVPVTLHVDSSQQPQFFKACPVSYALRTKVETELSRLQEQGMILCPFRTGQPQ